jgi:hypothetical protein
MRIIVDILGKERLPQLLKAVSRNKPGKHAARDAGLSVYGAAMCNQFLASALFYEFTAFFLSLP